MGEKDISAREMADAFLEEFLRDGSVVGRGVVLDRGRGGTRPLTEDAYVDMAKHMKRYHPHGMTENSTCKYIDQWKQSANEKIENEYTNKTSLQETNKREALSDASYQEAKEWLWDNLRVETLRAPSVKSLEDIGFSKVDLTLFSTEGKPLSQEAHEYATKIFYQVCKDLKMRFPYFTLPMPIFIPWDFTKIGAKGRASTDRRLSVQDKQIYERLGIDEKSVGRECYLSLGDMKHLNGETPNYKGGGGEEEFAKVIARHEIGHNLATKAVLEKWQEYYSWVYDTMRKASSHYDAKMLTAAYIGKTISPGAIVNQEEAIAELFSRYTSPAYKTGMMPKEIEDIASYMVTQYKGKKMDNIITTDSGVKSAKLDTHTIPQWAIRSLSYGTPVDPIPEKPKGMGIGWFDQWDGEWHSFETYEDMLRYVLDAYGFEKKHIDLIVHKIPQVRWTSYVLWEIKGMYAWNDESVEDIVNKYKDMAGTATSPELTEEEMNEIAKEVIANMHKDKGSVAQDGYEGIGFVFDPQEFDQNSFEWGAIYGINNIREEVKKMPEGTVIPDEQFLEMLAPLKMTAKVYAESHGKNKAWVKKTVLGVPKEFLNAFDVLSDGEGVSRERFLAVMTVEGICALAEGSVDSIHDLERFYDRKGEYVDREGYKVGDWVVIERNAPDKEVIHNIKRIIAFRGEGKDAEAIFWNKRKTDVITRKLEDCSEPFPNFDAAADYATDENWAEDEDLEYTMYLGAILQSMGLGMDAGIDPSDPDFWMKHDRARHGGHFDPETQTCSLREQMGLPTAKNKGER